MHLFDGTMINVYAYLVMPYMVMVKVVTFQSYWQMNDICEYQYLTAYDK